MSLTKYADAEAIEVLSEEQKANLRKEAGVPKLPKDPIKRAFRGILTDKEREHFKPSE